MDGWMNERMDGSNLGGTDRLTGLKNVQMERDVHITHDKQTDRL